MKFDVTHLNRNFEHKGPRAPVPAGTYKAVIETVRSDRKTKTGAPLLGVCFRILSGAQAAKVVWDSLALTEAAFGRLMHFLLALGLPAKTTSINTDEWVGRELLIVVAVESYQADGGEEIQRNTIKRFVPLPKTIRNTRRTTSSKAIEHTTPLDEETDEHA